MNKQEKNVIIKDYITQAFLSLKDICLKDKGLYITEEKYNKALDKFLDSDLDIDKIKLLIDKEKEKIIDSYKDWEEKERLRYLSTFDNKEEVNKMGITLNRQMIELMMIVNSTKADELNNIMSDLRITIPNQNLSLDEMKQIVFNKYRSTLVDRNNYYYNSNSNLNQKLMNVIKNSNLTPEQAEKLKNIVSNVFKNGLSSAEFLKFVESTFPKKISDRIFIELSESRDLEEVGIKSQRFSDWKDLFNKLEEFSSITIDFESKYPALVMANGDLYFEKLKRCLDFAKKSNKDVRLNALIFFEDCPKRLSDLDLTLENKKIVYNELLRYVDGITKFIAKYNQESLQKNGYEVVKSIDLFNELITRFPQDFNNSYLNRENLSNQNFESGWQKFLKVEDLCEIGLVARQNLPNVEFVYNETNLEDKNKLPYLKGILDRINDYEKNNQEKLNGKKIIDCIGTQMHLNPYITLKDLDSSLKTLSSYNYPIKITEYDYPLSEEYILSHTEKECNNEKSQKQSKLKEYIKANAKKYNIKQVTIWSINDSTNFLLDNKNKVRIKNNEKPLKSIYGGAFRKDELFNWKNPIEKQKYELKKQKNIIRAQQNYRYQKKQKNIKSKILTKNTTNKGYINIFILSLIVSFVVGVFLIIIVS